MFYSNLEYLFTVLCDYYADKIICGGTCYIKLQKYIKLQIFSSIFIHYKTFYLSIYRERWLIVLNVFFFLCFDTEIPDYYNKIAHMRNLVQSLPPPNRDTMEALFSHLRKYVFILHACIDIFYKHYSMHLQHVSRSLSFRVIQHGDENRMTVQNVAIVFGPTLLKPEVETANITTYMVFQNQIVEFILNEFESIFHMWLTWIQNPLMTVQNWSRMWLIY